MLRRVHGLGSDQQPYGFPTCKPSTTLRTPSRLWASSIERSRAAAEGTRPVRVTTWSLVWTLIWLVCRRFSLLKRALTRVVFEASVIFSPAFPTPCAVLSAALPAPSSDF